MFFKCSLYNTMMIFFVFNSIATFHALLINYAFCLKSFWEGKHIFITSVVIVSVSFIGFKVIPSQHFKVGSTLFQRCESTLKERWSDVENETKYDVGFSMLYKIDTTSVPDVETTPKQRCTTLVQRWHNVVST